MANLVGVRFKSHGRVYFFDPVNMDLDLGERVLVDTDEGPKEGQVVITPRQVLYSELQGHQKPVLQRVDE